jgi:NAD-dependent dihydropyrimidine dehydrogenase PreA subunit
MSADKYLSGVSTLKVNEGLCTGCGACVDVCPHQILFLEEGKIRIADIDQCMECGACSRNCPERAIFVRAGVGCANAVINGMLGRKSSECCCSVENDKSSGC